MRGPQSHKGAACCMPLQMPRSAVHCHCVPHEEHTAQGNISVCDVAVALCAQPIITCRITCLGKATQAAYTEHYSVSVSCYATRCKAAEVRLTCSGSSLRVSATAAKQASVSVLSAEGPGRAPAASPMASTNCAPEPTRRAKVLASDKAV